MIDMTALVSAMDAIEMLAERNAAAASAMTASAEDVTRSVESIAAVSEENSAAVEEVSAATQEMSAQAEEVVAHHVPAAGFLPKFGWQKGRHKDFLGSRPVHFFTDDLFDLVQGAQTEWQKGVNAAGEFANESGAQQEFMGGDFRVSRSFAEGRN